MADEVHSLSDQRLPLPAVLEGRRLFHFLDPHVRLPHSHLAYLAAHLLCGAHDVCLLVCEQGVDMAGKPWQREVARREGGRKEGGSGRGYVRESVNVSACDIFAIMTS